MATFHTFDTSFRISHSKFRRNCLARSGDILLTNECISSSEAEKEEGVGKCSEKSNPHMSYGVLCVFISGNFDIQSSNVTEAPGLRESIEFR
jgi:hypothetical protein